MIVCASGSRVSYAADPIGNFFTPPDRNTYTLLEPLPCVPTSNNPCTPGTLITKFTINNFIEYVFKFSIALAVLLATIMVIVGGFQYMTSAIPSVKKDGKEKFGNAAAGLAGILLSYLILQTIDPRLVQIASELPAICPAGSESEEGNVCNTRDVKNFYGKLDDDLKQLTNEKQIASLELEELKKEYEKQKLALKNKFENKEITPAQYIAESNILNTKIAEAGVKQTSIIAEGLGLSHLRVAYDKIHNPEQSTVDLKYYTEYDPSADLIVSGKYPTKVKNLIQDSYNRRLNELLAIQPQTDESATLISALSKQKKFYIAQVKEEETFTKVLELKEANLAGYVKGEYFGLDSKFLEDKLVEYEANIKNPQKAIDAGITAAEYSTVIKPRIDAINRIYKKKSASGTTTN